MARVNLSGMTVEADGLAKAVDQMLFERRADIEKRGCSASANS